MNLWTSSPEELRQAMLEQRLTRGCWVTDPATGEVRASHPLFSGLAQAVADDRRDYRGHEAAFWQIGATSDHLLSAFVHRTVRGQAAGGVRFWRYDTTEVFFRDGLRLSRGMGHKCALAGLWWGGGKGVIARRPDRDHRDPELRHLVYRDYGRFISSLCGCYVTAEDVGTTPADMAAIFSQTRHTTCIPPTMGGSGNPSVLTATGVVVAMEAALEHLGRGTLAGKVVAMQGLGNVALYMVGELLAREVKQIVGADIDAAAIATMRQRYPGAPLSLREVAAGDESILAEACDILAPNATGGILNPRTIPAIRAAVVCGAANNQLEEMSRDARLLLERDILYVPDFLANRMGIVNCANEQYGVLATDPAISAHLDRHTEHGVFRRCGDVFARAAASGRTPAEEAEQLAEELSAAPHPIWGHRGRQILAELLATNWATTRPSS